MVRQYVNGTPGEQLYIILIYDFRAAYFLYILLYTDTHYIVYY